MLLGIGLFGGLIGLFMARNTKPVKAIISTGKKYVIKSRLAQSVILSNAKETIINEFDKEKQEVREDMIQIEIEKKQLYKKQEYLNFLNYSINESINGSEISEEECEQLQSEKQIKEIEINVLDESIKQKENIIEQRLSSLKNYEKNILDKRLTDAEIAEIVFKQNNSLDKLQGKLQYVENLGESSLTNSVIMRVTGEGIIKGKMSINRRYELLEKYKKEN